MHLWSFTRTGFARTTLSKPRLTKLVDSGAVTGSEDPRIPTVRGMLRRGLTVQALREFILRQGASRNPGVVDWSILWAMNEEVIDPVAPYHTAVETRQMVTASVLNGPDTPYSKQKPRHPHNPAIGTRAVTYSLSILLDNKDAASLAIGAEVTLIGWRNAIVKECKVTGDGTVTDVALMLSLDGTEVRKGQSN